MADLTLLKSISDAALLRFGRDRIVAPSVIKHHKPEVLLGSPDSAVTIPQFEIKNWDGETSMRVVLGPPALAPVRIVDGKVEMEASNAVHRCYAIDDERFEWEIELKTKPSSNIFEYKIETRGLEFLWQDYEIEEPDTLEFIQKCLDRFGEYTPPYRPDKVRGSYAVYHESKKNNSRRRDQKEIHYGTGKAFHIFRPEAIDANGRRVWCEIYINAKTGLLRLTVPQDFLDSALYPIIIDPEIGYSTAGVSNRLMGTDNYGAQYDDYTASASEQVTEVWGYLYATATKYVEMGIYELVGGTALDGADRVGISGEIAVLYNGGSPDWYGETGLTIALTSGETYNVAVGGADGNVTVFYDFGSVGLSKDTTSWAATGGSLGDPWVHNSASASRISVYALVESVSSGIDVYPDPIALTLSTEAPTIVRGSFAVSPSSLSLGLDTVNPTVVRGSIGISPGALSLGLTTVDPSVVRGSITVSPGALALSLASVDPTVVRGSFAVSPDPLALILSMTTPTVDTGGGIEISPDPLILNLSIATPTIVRGSFSISPDPFSLALSSEAPTVVRGSFAVSPDPMVLAISSVDPTIQLGSISVSPEGLTLTLATVDPAIGLSSIVISPEALTLILSSTTPTVISGGIIFSRMRLQDITLSTGDLSTLGISCGTLTSPELGTGDLDNPKLTGAEEQ